MDTVESDPWCFSVVYINPKDALKWESMKKLKEFTQNVSMPWMIVGDFNKISIPSEKAGEAPANVNTCTQFRSWMEDCKLIDMCFIKPKFTWRGQANNGHRRVFERLNHTMCTMEWQPQFPEGSCYSSTSH